MNLGMIIMGAITIAFLVLPFILANMKQKKHHQQLLQALTNLATAQDCKITKHEVRGDIVMGLDETKNVVFFYKQLKDKAVERFLNLSDTNVCKMNIVRKKGNSHIADVQSIALVFSPADKSKGDIVWELFNSDESVQIVGELELAKKFESLINKRLAVTV